MVGSAPNGKSKAVAALKKREREKQAPRMHLKKVRAEIKPIGDLSNRNTVEARVILSDLSPRGVAFFSSVPFENGQVIALTLDEPKRFFVKGRITWCQEHDAQSHVLGSNPFSYRIGLRFLCESEEEGQEIRKYCDLIASQYIFGNAKAA